MKSLAIAIGVIAVVAVVAIGAFALWSSRITEEYEHDRASVSVAVVLDSSCPVGTIDPGARVVIENRAKRVLKRVFYQVTATHPSQGKDGLGWYRDFERRLGPNETSSACVHLENVNIDARDKGLVLRARPVTVDFD